MQTLFCAALLAATFLVGCGETKPAPKPDLPSKTPVAKPELPPSVYENTADADAEPKVAADAEPNDSPDQALVLTSGRPLSGHIGPPLDSKGRDGDQDWYVLTVDGDEPVVARAELTGADDLDVVLEWVEPKLLRRGKYRAIVQADVVVKKPGPETLPALALKPGKHYFRVREAWYRRTKREGSESPYVLTVTTSPWQAGVDVEPNDDDAESLSTAFEALGEGLIGHVGDTDLWRVDIPADVTATHLRVTIDGIAGLAMTGALMLTPKTKAVREGRGSKSAPLVFRNVRAPDLLEGQARSIYVRVGAKYGASVQDRYSVKVEAEAARVDGASTEFEPNDGVDAATPVDPAAVSGYGTTTLYGHIDHRRDRDFFAVTVTKPTSLALSLTPPLKADYAVDVIGPEGTTPSAAASTRAGQSENLHGVLLTPGTWHLVVRRQRGDPDNAGAYALKLDFADGADTESEPNDKPGSRLVTLAAGKTMKGWLSSASDNDYWSIDLTAEEGGKIVTFKVKAPDGARLKAGIYTKEAKVLTVSEPLSGQASFTHYFEPGVYLLNVFNDGKANAGSPQPYGITMLE